MLLLKRSTPVRVNGPLKLIHRSLSGDVSFLLLSWIPTPVSRLPSPYPSRPQAGAGLIPRPAPPLPASPCLHTHYVKLLFANIHTLSSPFPRCPPLPLMSASCHCVVPAPFSCLPSPPPLAPAPPKTGAGLRMMRRPTGQRSSASMMSKR